jgi:hypothetical protein
VQFLNSRQVVPANWLFRQSPYRNSQLDQPRARAMKRIPAPKLQVSLVVQFAGNVSGSDQFQSTLTQFEIQEI